MARIEEELNTNFKEEHQRMLSNILFTTNWIRQRFEAVMKPFGLSGQQFNVLRILRGAGDWLNMNEMRERMIEKSPNTTRLVDKLVDKEWVIRRRCDVDRRVVHLKISEAGLALLTKVDEVDPNEAISFIQNLTEEEMRTLSNLLDKIRG
ncbi:MAG TPA: MarR family transcriptional regulator [Cytophagales bacterium]|nr:MarR family transcriptional regulator [Cytophagales bacterium]HAA22672.1 MarR family transcriptional regulator [Cytophagales bacterium]HAP58016.1 MarR family transcriptional regulator [Cytophagales bacterium]